MHLHARGSGDRGAVCVARAHPPARYTGECSRRRIFVERMQVHQVNIELSYAPPAAAGEEVVLPAGAELPRLVQVRRRACQVASHRVATRLTACIHT